MSAPTEEIKQAIDALSLEQLLREHRFSPLGDQRYQGPEGDYRVARLNALRLSDPQGYAAASKKVGWGYQ